MKLFSPVRVFAAVAVAVLGCHGERSGAPLRILCLGDSITAGITHSSTPETPMRRDPLGGYPGRLARRLDGGVVVVNRGVGGATTAIWLLDPHADLGRQVWPSLRRLWPDLAREPPSGATSLADVVLQNDRPDTVLILLGINDLASEVAAGGDFAGAIVRRLATLRAQALAVARVALVATVLPNHRESAELHERLNAGIRAAFPDHLPLGERFAAAGWERLLGDEVHPNEDGYEVLTDIVADEIRKRLLLSAAPSTRTSQTPAAATPGGTLPPR